MEGISGLFEFPNFKALMGQYSSALQCAHSCGKLTVGFSPKWTAKGTSNVSSALDSRVLNQLKRQGGTV